MIIMCVCVWCARFAKIDRYGCPLYYSWRCKTVNINSVDLNLCGSRWQGEIKISSYVHWWTLYRDHDGYTMIYDLTVKLTKIWMIK